MKQALHIFRKDARQMRYEIVLTVVAMSVYAVAAMGPAPGAVSSPTPAMVLVPLAAWVLIARVIHAETLPGDSQFWLTRPYRRGSLLLAKALFIVAFVMLPFLAADAAIALGAGFRLGAVAPALLWRHAAFAAGFVIPVAALASVTSGMAQMLLGFLVAWVVAVAPAYLPNPKIDLQWEPLLWIGLTGGILVIAIAAAGCVGMQYARRSTWVNRGLISAAWIVAEFGFALVPWKLAYQVQTVVAGGVPGAAACKVEADVRRPWLGAVNVEADRAEVELPVVLSGLPAGPAPVIDALTVEVRSPDGEVWSSGKSPTTRLTTFGTVMSIETVLPRPFYERVKDKPVRVNGAVFLTFKGGRRLCG
ncbi:MAG: hypothetical protein JSU00_00150 [Acidobacteria bacterium]|nr:hypothetical protein [Acidobacteriota bacterium]